MNTKTILFRIVVFLIGPCVGLFLLTRCANMSPPEGGPKDEDPPILLMTIPQQNSTNFIGKRIELIFDEPVNGQAVKKELIISPRISTPYTVRAKRNVLTIIFDEELRPNTTFNLNFREGIEDFAEKNKAQDVQLAFSTGDYIDTLSINGYMIDLQTGQPSIGGDVLLYDATDTLTIEDGDPFYVTKTDSTGFYRFRNLAQGEYLIYGLVEKDNNLKYAKRDEKVAFLDRTLNLVDSALYVNLTVSDYDNLEFKFLRLDSKKRYAEIIFNKTPLRYELAFDDEDMDSVLFHRIDGPKIQIIHGLNEETDSVLIAYVAYDSLGNMLEGEGKVKFLPSPKNKEEFTVELFRPLAKDLSPDKTYDIALKFNKPVVFFDEKKLFLLSAANAEDKKGGADTLNLAAYKPGFNYSRTIYTIPGIKPEGQLSLNLLKAAFVSIDNDTTKKEEFPFTLRDANKHGAIKMKIETVQEKFTVQLLNEKFEVEDEVSDKKTFRFEFAKPGKKKFRVLIPRDGKSPWSKGSFKDRILPDRVVMFPEPVELKENWEIGDIDLKF